MSAAIEASIIEHLHRLDDQRQAQVLDFVEYLASKSGAASPTVARPQNRSVARSGQIHWRRNRIS
jgi:hypothetical protein